MADCQQGQVNTHQETKREEYHKGFPPVFLLLITKQCRRLHLLVGNSLHDLSLQLFAEFGIVFQQSLCGIASLCKFRALIREPRAALLHDAVFHTKVQNLSDL